jgi:predicted RNase H-like HicB family nuclease
MYNYDFRVFWSEEDGEYVAVIDGVEEFSGITVLAETPHQALEELGNVLQGVIEMYNRKERPLPAPHALTAHTREG